MDYISEDQGLLAQRFLANLTHKKLITKFCIKSYKHTKVKFFLIQSLRHTADHDLFFILNQGFPKGGESPQGRAILVSWWAKICIGAKGGRF